MPITRNTDQHPGQELEIFYQEIAAWEASQYKVDEAKMGIGQHMLRLLAFINNLFPATQLWGLTSLEHLIVQNANDWQADWLVRIAGGINGTFYFEYLLPPAARP